MWSRVIFFFSALILVKGAVIFSLRAELYQAHWRITSAYPAWYGYPALYALAWVLGLNLWIFGGRCAAQGVKAVRCAFAALMLIAALFIALTFFEGASSYLAAVMSGALRGSDLAPYFAMNLFFRPPYLAFWAAALAIGYVWAVRSGREAQVICGLAVLAPLYVAVNLGHFARFQKELCFVLALGVACLVAAWRSRNGLRVGLVLAPWGLTLFLFVLFGRSEVWIGAPRPEFLILAGTTVVLFLGSTALAWRQGYDRAWSAILPFLSVGFLVLTMDKFPMASNYRNLLVVGLGLPRYFVGEAVLAGLLLLAAALLHRLGFGRAALRWLDAFGWIAVGVALLDAHLTRILGIRLDGRVWSSAGIDSPEVFWRITAPYLPAFGVTVGLVVAAYGAMRHRLSRRRSDPAPARVPMSGNWRYVLTAAAALALAGTLLVAPDKAQGQSLGTLASSSSWWRWLSQATVSLEDFVQDVHALGLDCMLAPPAPPQRARRDLNVVVVFGESLFNPHLSLFGGKIVTQPLLAGYRDRMQLFPNFHSVFPKSIHARFAAFTGLYPVQEHYTFTRNPVPVKSLFEILNDQGYECSLFYSSFLDYTNFRDLLRGRGLAKVYDADTMPGERKTERVKWGLKEEETLGAIQEQLRAYGRSRGPFCLTYVPVCPHHPFDGVPERFRQFPMRQMGDLTPRYLNELLYMDWIITQLLDTLRETGLLDHTLVVITSDHGELTGARDGLIGHGWLLDPELTNVPLIILDPAQRAFARHLVPGSHVDLLPTLIDLLGLPLPEQQLYQGVSLYRPEAAAPRGIFLNSHRQFARLDGQTMVFGDRQAGGEAAGNTFVLAATDSAVTYVPAATRLPPPDMARFEAFQSNLLRHYQHYATALRHRESAAREHASPTSETIRCPPGAECDR